MAPPAPRQGHFPRRRDQLRNDGPRRHPGGLHVRPGFRACRLQASQMTTPSFLTDRAINVAGLVAEASSPGCGAVITFLGTVRSSPEDGAIEGIEYSAYP